MRVLDAGSGPGRLTIPAAERVGPSGEVVALDVQEAMIVRVRQQALLYRLANVRTLVGPIEASTLYAGRFDRALLVAVLGEVPDRTSALRALHAALRPGGTLSITEIIPDYHYQKQSAVRHFAEGAGFLPGPDVWDALRVHDELSQTRLMPSVVA